MTRFIPAAGRAVEVDGRAVAAGAGITIVDSFESGNLDAYTASLGTKSEFQVASNTVFDGENSIERHGSTGTARIVSQPGDGLNAYPSKPVVFKHYIRQQNANDQFEFGFGRNSSGHIYNVVFDSGGPQFEILASDDGGASFVDTLDHAITTDAWYEFKVTWDDGSLGGNDGDITADITDITNDTFVGTMSGNHTGINGDGIRIGGFLGDSSRKVFQDFYHIL